jgi:hypothetical protein
MKSIIEDSHLQHLNLILIDKMVTDKTVSLEEAGNATSAFFHYSNENLIIQYLNKPGCNWFGTTNEEIKDMGRSFIEKFFHPSTIKYEFPKITSFYKNNNYNKVYLNLQQILDPRKMNLIYAWQ